MTKTMTYSILYVDTTVAQEAASAVVTALRNKKTDKASEMPAKVEIKAERTDDSIVLHVSDEDRQGTATVKADTISNGTDEKKIKAEVADVFAKQFNDVDVDKFAEVVQEKANKLIERAVKMSKASATNPNMKHKQEKKESEPLF